MKPKWQDEETIFQADNIWPSLTEAKLLIDSYFHQQVEWLPLLDLVEFTE